MRKRRVPFDAPRRRRRFSPLAWISILASLLVILVGGALVLLLPHIGTHAAGVDQQTNMDCTLIVPTGPLSARGLATPFQLVATDPNNGPCNEANAAQAAFVQGSIFNPNTGQIFVYNPLVIDKGTQPAVRPVVPRIADNAIVALWFGFNGNNLTLQSSGNSLRDGRCVNGVNGSIFGQFSYCNAPRDLFRATNRAIHLGMLIPQPLGTARDGKACPTVRDFGVVDQDQSDNVTTSYLVTKNGRVAQSTAVNQKRLPTAKAWTNGSDNRLLDAFVDPALGCTPWMAPDLADPGHLATALPLNELQAMVYQQTPVALVPMSDPMVLNNNNPDLNKTNLYRAGVDQPRAQNNGQADPKAYCQNLVDTGAPRIVLDAPMTVKAAPPDPTVGNTLLTFLAQRFVATYTLLNCQQMLGKAGPIATTQDGNGVATSATFNGQPIDTSGGTDPNCSINGETLKGCTGSATINGQPCQLTFANNTVTMTCNKQN